MSEGKTDRNNISNCTLEELTRSPARVLTHLIEIGLDDEDIGLLVDSSARSARRWRLEAGRPAKSKDEKKLRQASAVVDFILDTCEVEPPEQLIHFLRTPHIDPETLESRTPLDEIAHGDIVPVIRLAQTIFSLKERSRD